MMPVGGVDDLAHRDPDQQFPELLATGGGGFALELAEAEARVHALEDVLLVFAPADAVVEVPAHEHLQRAENRSQMMRAASSRSWQSGERRCWTHSVSEPIELMRTPRLLTRTHGNRVAGRRIE